MSPDHSWWKYDLRTPQIIGLRYGEEIASDLYDQASWRQNPGFRGSQDLIPGLMLTNRFSSDRDDGWIRSPIGSRL